MSYKRLVPPASQTSPDTVWIQIKPRLRSVLLGFQQTCRSLSWWNVPPRPRWPTRSSGSLCSSRATQGTRWLPPARWNGLRRVLRETDTVVLFHVYVRRMSIYKTTVLCSITGSENHHHCSSYHCIDFWTRLKASSEMKEPDSSEKKI